MQSPRSLLRLFVWLVGLSLALPLAGMAQTYVPAPLPPEAQAVMKKGIIAAQQQDYPLALRFFQDARKLAPAAPEVFYNLGLAESKIPGRELRAIAWFGAYLAANPTAPNAAAVKEQIDVLDVKNQSNIARLIKSVQDAANQIDTANQDHRDDLSAKVAHISNLTEVAELLAEAGDITSALNTAALFKGTAAYAKSAAHALIARNQARNGDVTGALKTVDFIERSNYKEKSSALRMIGSAQTKNNDIAGAQKTLALARKAAELMADPQTRGYRMAEIAESQTEVGDIVGAQKSVTFIQGEYAEPGKSSAQKAIAEAQLKAGDIAGAQKTADLISDTGRKNATKKSITEAQAKAVAANASNSTPSSTSAVHPPIKPVIAVSDWLKKLDDSYKSDFGGYPCSLNTEPFLDLAGYLKSLPPSDDPQKVFDSLLQTAEKIVTAQNVITGMLKQQAKK